MAELPALKISPGNMKTGRVPAVSLRPGKDCVNCRHCVSKCYAMKSYRMYPNVRKAWSGNAELFSTDPKRFEAELTTYLEKKKPRFFRWHVSGDIKSKRYFNMMKRVAERFPATRFLAFTKAFKFLTAECPANLQIVLSVWHTMKRSDVPALPYPKAFAGPCDAWPGFADALECPGNCETCGACWDLNKTGRNVRFNLH